MARSALNFIGGGPGTPPGSAALREDAMARSALNFIGGGPGTPPGSAALREDAMARSAFLIPNSGTSGLRDLGTSN